MPKQLFELAKKEGIKIVWWEDLPYPLEGYFIQYDQGYPPAIYLGRHLASDIPRLRTHLAHELGHFYTTSGDTTPKQYLSVIAETKVSRAEYLANRWAAFHLMPWDEVNQALREGLIEKWELAERFRVLEELVVLRMRLFKEGK